MKAFVLVFPVLVAIVNSLSVRRHRNGTRSEGADRAAFREYTERARDGYAGAVSGMGSEFEAARPFVQALLGWLHEHPEVTSLVEASAGHWPSGWQRNVTWPSLDYIGVDILQKMVDDDMRLLSTEGLDKIGLKSMKFLREDMLMEPLPPADLLLTKDTLIHFPNADVKRFLELSVTTCPPRFRYVMFVHDSEDHGPTQGENNKDIDRLGDFHPLDLAAAPFDLPVKTLLAFTANRRKVVQLLEPGTLCSEGQRPPPPAAGAAEHERQG